MINKISKKILIVALIFAMSIPMISYAINLPTEKEEKKFLSSDKVEASKGEIVTLGLNLDLIEYEEFEFTLNSNINLENIDTKQENIETTTENNTFKIIANKLELNINQIDIYYQIPESIEIGTKINLTGIVKKYVSEDDKDEENNDDQVEDDEDIQVEDETQEVTITITVVEKQEEQESNQNNNQNDSQNQMMGNNTKNDQSTMNNEQSKAEQQVVSQVQTKTVSTSLSSVQETNTYKGESNNYLKSLEITNYNINPEFAKTNTTYFLELESEVTKISINAEAEDENATVNIYGNDDLQDEENKILISVTAENGDVKIYRIYVTKK